jgi:hypothetical protein
MKNGTVLITALALGLHGLAGCSSCGHGAEAEGYTLDEQNSGEIVAPVSLGHFPKTVEPNGGPECNGSNLFCAEHGADSPTCDTICISLNAKAHLPPTYGEPRYLTLDVRIPGPPPKTTLTLPSPNVDATFVLSEGALYEEFAVTSGSVTVHIKQGELVVEVEATATTPAGETISVHNGRYALVNGRYEAYCQQD